MVAGILHHLGVFIGEDLVMGNMPEQPTGYFEDREFLHLNERILTMAGGGWGNPPSQKAINSVADDVAEEIADLVGRRSEHEVWGWKDPRTCLTLPLYLRFLSNPHVIIVRREFQTTVSSLVKREKGLMDREAATKITRIYFKRIFDNITAYDCAAKDSTPFLKRIPVDYRTLAKSKNVWPLICNLRLRANAGQIDAARNHIKPELNHWQSHLSLAAQEAAQVS